MATSTADDLITLYSDFISHDESEVPYKLLKILVERYEALEQVSNNVRALNDVLSLTGVNLDNYARKWQVFRQGKTDAEMLQAISNRIAIYNSGSTLSDFINILKLFDVFDGAIIEEKLPPETAEINVLLDSLDTNTFNRVIEVLKVIKAAGIELDSYNTLDSGDKLLAEIDDSFSDEFITYEDGDFILMEQ